MNNNSSMRVLFTVGGVVIAFFLFWWIGKPYLIDNYIQTSRKITMLDEEVTKKDQEINLFVMKKGALAEKFNKLSLPSNPDSAAAQYSQMLKPLLKECGLTVDNFKPPESVRPAPASGKKTPRHIILPFDIRAKGTLPQLAQALEALQRLPLAHRVKTLEIDRADTRDKEKAKQLAIHMVIEAMVVADANNTKPLPGIDKLEPAKIERRYNEMALRNPFIGLVPVKIEAPPPPPPPVAVVTGTDPRDFILIDTITFSAGEANLRNKLFNSKLRLQTSSKQGYNTFRITNETGDHTFVKGKVLKIDPRDVYFQVGEEVYGFHFGQTMTDAMSHPLTETEIGNLSLTSLIDPEFAGVSKTKRPTTPTKKGR